MSNDEDPYTTMLQIERLKIVDFFRLHLQADLFNSLNSCVFDVIRNNMCITKISSRPVCAVEPLQTIALRQVADVNNDVSSLRDLNRLPPCTCAEVNVLRDHSERCRKYFDSLLDSSWED